MRQLDLQFEGLGVSSGRLRTRIERHCKHPRLRQNRPVYDLDKALSRLDGQPLWRSGDARLSSSTVAQDVHEFWREYQDAEDLEDQLWCLRQHDRALVYAWAAPNSPLREQIQPDVSLDP